MDTRRTGLHPLGDPQLIEVLTKLHREANRQNIPLIGRFATQFARWASGRPLVWERLSPQLSTYYLAVDPKSGMYLYFLARALQVRKVVEFGTSFGISTIYLAAAVRDNGGGVVIGTERVPEKANQAMANLRAAGLADYAEIRLGNAPDTLYDLEGPVDMLFNDGFPQAMLPVLQCVAPKMRPGAVVLAGNTVILPADHAEYLDWVRNPANGFCSTQFSMAAGGEFSVKGSQAEPIAS